MKKDGSQADILYELSDEDQEHIRTIFFESVAPKLMKCGARLGNLSCEFAGEQYNNWMIHFRSAGSGFEIIEFEYDEDGEGISLDF